MGHVDDNIENMADAIERLNKEIENATDLPPSVLKVAKAGYDIAVVALRVTEATGRKITELMTKLQSSMEWFIDRYAKALLPFSGLTATEVSDLLSRYAKGNDPEVATYIILRSILGALAAAVRAVYIGVPRMVDLITRVLASQP